MTLIVNPRHFKSKAELKKNLDPGMIQLYNPSIMDGWNKLAHELPVGFSDTVTNHPLRTKFAKITKTANGWKVV